MSTLRVLIVCNNAFIKGNGLCTAVQSQLKRLRENGVDARLMAAVNADPYGMQPDFPLKHFHFPFFESLIYANGFRYAMIDKRRMREAIGWADIVHVLEAFPMEGPAVQIAKKMGKPIVGTFHLYPENITANLGVAKVNFLNNILLNIWRDKVYNFCSHIQCPTELVREHLQKHKFKSELRVISNGIDIPGENPTTQYNGKIKPIRLLCIGRLSNEKGQDTLLKAMRYSRHAAEIELHFAGKGPVGNRYKRKAKRLVREGVLKYPPVFGFYNKKSLADLANISYLYIHCAWIEVEGLSCVESLRYGIVPIIAKGWLSATSQFAVDDRSVFPIFDAKTLAERIDWWIEHPEEHDAMRTEYVKVAQQYDQKRCTRQLMQMYRDAIGQK